MKLSRQNEAVLNALKAGPKTSWQLQQLGICSHTSRISELRKQHTITKSEKWDKGRRIVTYTLQDSGATAEPQNEHVNGPSERVTKCSNCGGAVERKPKARPPLDGEEVFCQDSCRDEFWNRRKATKRLAVQQSLEFCNENQQAQRERTA